MRHVAVLLISAVALGVAALVPSVSDAAFTQCPAVDHDTSCQFLITVTDKGVQVATDPGQGPYDGEDDALIGIQNSSSKAVSSIPLSAENDLFGFDNDGICEPGSAPIAPGCVVLFKNSSGNLTEHPGHSCPPETEACGIAPPAGEPAGLGFSTGVSIEGYGENGDAVSGYEGPGVYFTSLAPTNNSGVVNFSPALVPGASAYFSLESPPVGKSITVGSPTTLTTSLSAAGQTGASVTVAQHTPVTDTATVAGVAAATSTGEVSYSIYKDSKCTVLAASGGSGTVTNGVAISPPETSLAPGTYYWEASYSGDINNQGSASACGSETLIVAHKASLGLPSSKQCVSKRHFVVHPRAPHHVKLVHVEVLINGKLVSSGPLNHHHTFVDLRGLPKGTFKVSLITTSSTGTLFDDTRTFHTCVPGHHKKKK